MASDVKVTDKTGRLIWGEFAGRCAVCREKVIEKVSPSDNRSLTGEVAHIVGKKDGSARSDYPLPVEKKDTLPNLMLLCRNDHKIVDDFEDVYTVERLRETRESHLEWIETSLVTLTPWRSNLSQITYVNVPRLALLSSELGHDVDLSNLGMFNTLHSLGWELNKVLSAFKIALRSTFPRAANLDNIDGAYPTLTGTTCSFERTVYTKNVPILSQNETAPTGDIDEDPHIYIKESSFKLLMTIDPRWITTSTAFSLFRPSGGRVTLAGLCTITSVDPIEGTVLATPLILGVPESTYERVLDGEFPSTSHTPTSDLKSLANLETGRRVDIRFCGPPDRCDLCQADLSMHRFFVDGVVVDRTYWAFMCEQCFELHGKGVGWGLGQLYFQESAGSWLLVGGFSPDC